MTMQDHIAPSGYIKIPGVSQLLNQVNQFEVDSSFQHNGLFFSGNFKVFGALQVSTKA